eukprot:1108300_1
MAAQPDEDKIPEDRKDPKTRPARLQSAADSPLKMPQSPMKLPKPLDRIPPVPANWKKKRKKRRTCPRRTKNLGTRIPKSQRARISKSKKATTTSTSTKNTRT